MWWATRDAGRRSTAHSPDEYCEPPCGAHRESTANCSNSASMSGRPRWQNTWRREGGHHPRAGRLFLPNHADAVASIDMFVVPTISFRLLYGLLILRHSRQELLWLGVTEHPSAEWIARLVTEACGWKEVPRYLVRDRDGAYGEAFIRRLAAMGIRDRPTSARSPWQNGYAERLIGSIRRDCLDHVVVFGERHLRHLLSSYQRYYNEARTHLSLQKDAPISRDANRVGRLLVVPILGGLHHQYVRV
jgi:transposase InsO family protein